MGWSCPTCGRELTTQQGMRQHHTKVHGVPLPNRTCEGCSAEFYDPKAQRAYCDDCNPNAGEHNGNWRGGKETGECRLCGGEFSYYPSEKRGVYCPTCVAESEEFLGTPYFEVRDVERIERRCDQCNLEMNGLASEAASGSGRFCSRDCLNSWTSENWKGEGHPAWSDSGSVYSRSWWKTREAVRKRDDHTCQSCHASRDDLGREPDVHHIVPIRRFDDPQDAHRIANLVCLCKRCHRRVETGTIDVPRPHREGE